MILQIDFFHWFHRWISKTDGTCLQRCVTFIVCKTYTVFYRISSRASSMFHNCHRPQYCPLWYFTVPGSRFLSAWDEDADSSVWEWGQSDDAVPAVTISPRSTDLAQSIRQVGGLAQEEAEAEVQQWPVPAGGARECQARSEGLTSVCLGLSQTEGNSLGKVQTFREGILIPSL